MAGNIEGTPLPLGYLGGAVSTDIDNGLVYRVLGDADSTAIVVRTREDGTTVGWLKMLGENSPIVGITYCLSKPTLRKYSAMAYSITFTSIGRLGVCPGRLVQGRVGVCW